jgi:hypothetical protein
MALDTTDIEARSEPCTAPPGLLSIGSLDKRTRPFRRYEAIRAAVLSDLGGEENTSEVQRQMISKFSTLAIQLETMEVAALVGEDIDIDLFGRCCGHLRRIAEVLGFHRVARAVPDLGAYLASRPAPVAQDSFSARSATQLPDVGEDHTSGRANGEGAA